MAKQQLQPIFLDKLLEISVWIIFAVDATSSTGTTAQGVVQDSRSMIHTTRTADSPRHVDGR